MKISEDDSNALLDTLRENDPNTKFVGHLHLNRNKFKSEYMYLPIDLDDDSAEQLGKALRNNTIVTTLYISISQLTASAGIEHLQPLLKFIRSASQLRNVGLYGYQNDEEKNNNDENTQNGDTDGKIASTNSSVGNATDEIICCFLGAICSNSAISTLTVSLPLTKGFRSTQIFFAFLKRSYSLRELTIQKFPESSSTEKSVMDKELDKYDSNRFAFALGRSKALERCSLVGFAADDVDFIASVLVQFKTHANLKSLAIAVGKDRHGECYDTWLTFTSAKAIQKFLSGEESSSKNKNKKNKKNKNEAAAAAADEAMLWYYPEEAKEDSEDSQHTADEQHLKISGLDFTTDSLQPLVNDLRRNPEICGLSFDNCRFDMDSSLLVQDMFENHCISSIKSLRLGHNVEFVFHTSALLSKIVIHNKTLEGLSFSDENPDVAATSYFTTFLHAMEMNKSLQHLNIRETFLDAGRCRRLVRSIPYFHNLRSLRYTVGRNPPNHVQNDLIHAVSRNYVLEEVHFEPKDFLSEEDRQTLDKYCQRNQYIRRLEVTPADALPFLSVYPRVLQFFLKQKGNNRSRIFQSLVSFSTSSDASLKKLTKKSSDWEILRNKIAKRQERHAAKHASLEKVTPSSGIKLKTHSSKNKSKESHPEKDGHHHKHHHHTKHHESKEQPLPESKSTKHKWSFFSSKKKGKE